MRSEIAKKILSENPQEVKEKVRDYGNKIMNEDYKRSSDAFKDRKQIIDAEIFEIYLNLTVQEQVLACAEFANRKWHRLNTATIDFKPESKGEENK